MRSKDTSQLLDFLIAKSELYVNPQKIHQSIHCLGNNSRHHNRPLDNWWNVWSFNSDYFVCVLVPYLLQ